MENKIYRGGRPELPQEERSDFKVTVRFTKLEHKLLKERKSTTKAKDLSAFIRNVCLQKPLVMKTQLDTFQDETLSLLVEMRADLLRIGVNINQSSKRINSTTDYQDLQREVDNMASQMQRIDAQLRAVILSLSTEPQAAY
ncbi:plasmid mobilization relaxosome protein MobC [Spirosoma sp. BT702]|uniref:Plasmid mobilization relaxosome protein MobC n=1 Tax=Spirosoma profusum TaxID=2771354 RepID=A0A926Y4P5_9BACT|nr:plasmid mobilization relaxosome protein MobC [Spirosoma profusum]MBD2703371.1 plasmid mobilization relaxosome protein MobC [Spirosoma profusum]